VHCRNCGAELPAGATYCSQCGASISNDTSTPTYSSYTTPESRQATVYGLGPYGNAPQQDPYTFNTMPAPPPPPPAYLPPYPSPASRRRGHGVVVIIGIVALVVLLLSTGLIALIAHGGSTLPSPVAASPTAKNAASPAATDSATRNPYPPNTGTLVLDDPIHDNSKGSRWDEGTITNAGTCGFTGGTYHIHPLVKGLICVPEASNLVFSNLVFEVKLTIMQGDQAAVIVRLNQTNGNGYYFYITIQGSYSLCSNTCTKPLMSGSISVINKGLNQTNLVALVASGSTISAYVNNQFIASANDTTNTQGQLGVESYSNAGPGDVVASDARAWKL
jgi:zinc-ribbon domain